MLVSAVHRASFIVPWDVIVRAARPICIAAIIVLIVDHCVDQRTRSFSTSKAGVYPDLEPQCRLRSVGLLDGEAKAGF